MQTELYEDTFFLFPQKKKKKKKPKKKKKNKYVANSMHMLFSASPLIPFHLMHV